MLSGPERNDAMNTQRNIEQNETKCRRTFFLSHASIMRLVFFSVLIFLILAGCTSQTGQTNQVPSLTEARSNFKTILLPQNVKKEPIEQAPKEVFLTIKYPSQSGELWAYLSPNPGDGKKIPCGYLDHRRRLQHDWGRVDSRAVRK